MRPAQPRRLHAQTLAAAPSPAAVARTLARRRRCSAPTPSPSRRGHPRKVRKEVRRKTVSFICVLVHRNRVAGLVSPELRRRASLPYAVPHRPRRPWRSPCCSSSASGRSGATPVTNGAPQPLRRHRAAARRRRAAASRVAAGRAPPLPRLRRTGATASFFDGPDCVTPPSKLPYWSIAAPVPAFNPSRWI
jgi:hypothetical protein